MSTKEGEGGRLRCAFFGFAGLGQPTVVYPPEWVLLLYASLHATYSMDGVCGKEWTICSHCFRLLTFPCLDEQCKRCARGPTILLVSDSTCATPSPRLPRVRKGVRAHCTRVTRACTWWLGHDQDVSVTISFRYFPKKKEAKTVELNSLTLKFQLFSMNRRETPAEQ